VGDSLTDSLAECIDEDLADNEEEDAKSNMAQWPSILKSSHDEQDLHDDVDCEEYGAKDVEDDEKTNSVVGTQTGPALEGQDADDESDGEHGGRADSKQPDTKECTIFIQLKTDEACDHEGNASGGSEAVLHSDEPGICARARRDDAAVDEERDDGEQEVAPEETDDLLATDSGELAANMDDHDDSHEQSADVGDASSALEDDRVGHLDCARVAGRLYPFGALDTIATDHCA